MRNDAYDHLMSTLLRDLHEEELRARLDASLDRQLAVFLSMQQPVPVAA
jgi:hypothetical protein